MATRYFCSCREPHLHPKASTNWQGLIPDSVRDDLTFHKLEELHYCPTCHQLRCPLCTETEIAYKYCPHCLRQMPKKSTYCEKSCFRCPVENCGGYMNVSSESVRSEDDVKQFLGKRFLFTCHICHWTYTTKLITAPQSVASIDRPLDLRRWARRLQSLCTFEKLLQGQNPLREATWSLRQAQTAGIATKASASVHYTRWGNVRFLKFPKFLVARSPDTAFVLQVQNKM